jgi:uncharacterized protein (TIGR03435 family)
MLKNFRAAVSILFVLAAGTLFAQTPPAPAFEVASIRAAAPLDPQKIMAGKMHVGMSIDGQRVDIGFVSIADMIRIAYKVKPYQVTGPDWMSSQRFDVIGKIPEGVSKDLVPEMLQALLVERFKLTIHRDTKEHSTYALIVGKGGPKMKEAEPDPPPPPPNPDAPPAEAGAPPTPPSPSGEKGVMVINTGEGKMSVRQSNDGKGATMTGGPMGQMKMSMGEGGLMHMEFGKVSMTAFAEMLSRFTDRPVIDKTELKGNYQVALDLTLDDLRNIAKTAGVGAAVLGGPGPGAGGDGNRPADAASTPSGTSVFASVQKMGLKLESEKLPVETIVVDHLEKVPTEN